MKVKLEKHRLDEIRGTACAWLGCHEEYPIPKGSSSVDSMPEGWRSLVVAKGSLFDPRNILHADVDGSLCPKHYRQLLSILKIGQVKDMLEKGQVE